VYRWGVVLQGTGKPYHVPRATLYDVDANAVTCANLSAFSGAHSDIRHLEINRGHFLLLPAVSGCVPYSVGRQCLAHLITSCRSLLPVAASRLRPIACHLRRISVTWS
jgi:hypothetical protein